MHDVVSVSVAQREELYVPVADTFVAIMSGCGVVVKADC